VKAHAAGSKRQVRAGRIRKLVPTAPSTLKANPQVPPAVAQAAAGCTDPALLLLQSTFLDMHSASQQSVPPPVVTSPRKPETLLANDAYEPSLIHAVPES
jgi:hypothetical protein